MAFDDGSCGIVWRQFDDLDAPAAGLRLRRRFADGSLGTELRLLPAGSFWENYKLAGDRRARIVVAHGDYFGGLRVQTFDRDARALSAVSEQPTVAGNWNGALAVNPAGDAVVAWTSGLSWARTSMQVQRLKAGCLDSEQRACLGDDGRFDIRATWTDGSLHPHDATATRLTSNSAGLSCVSPSNVELLVKVLDGRALNGHYWLSVGSLTNLEYTLTVTDTVSGAKRTYVNRGGLQRSFADTAAF